MSENPKVDVTIIGAGLTGLSLAHFLKKAGKNVRLIEKTDRVGGVINSIQKDGFLFETGPNTGLASNDAVDQLFKDLKGKCTPEPGREDSKDRWIWKKGKWHSLPSGPISGIRTKLFTTKDKFRILGEPFRSKGTDPFETVADLVKRRMGKSFLEYAVDPFISGVYAGDPNYLVTQYALAKLYRLEQNYASFIKGGLKRGKELKLERAAREFNGMFSIEGGMVQLTNAISTGIGSERILLNSKNIQVKRAKDQYELLAISGQKEENWKSSQVVFTTGISQFSETLPFVDSKLFDAITQLEYAKVTQVAIGFKHWKGMPINAYGGLIPSVEKRKALGILFPSSIFHNRAPKGGSLLSIFIGGYRHPEYYSLNDDEIQKIVLQEIKETLEFKNPKPYLMSIHRYSNAIPQYGKNSFERLKAINQIEKENKGLFIAGNIRDGIGMADRIDQAFKLAQIIISDQSD